MARKRDSLTNLEYRSQEYWERLLAEDGLSMEAGTSKRVSYVGTTAVLERIEGEFQAGTHDRSNDRDIRYKTNSTDKD